MSVVGVGGRDAPSCWIWIVSGGPNKGRCGRGVWAGGGAGAGGQRRATAWSELLTSTSGRLLRLPVEMGHRYLHLHASSSPAPEPCGVRPASVHEPPPARHPQTRHPAVLPFQPIPRIHSDSAREPGICLLISVVAITARVKWEFSPVIRAACPLRFARFQSVVRAGAKGAVSV